MLSSFLEKSLPEWCKALLFYPKGHEIILLQGLQSHSQHDSQPVPDTSLPGMDSRSQPPALLLHWS